MGNTATRYKRLFDARRVDAAGIARVVLRGLITQSEADIILGVSA
ncbi:MAG: hypothetical protein RR998_06345 [Oscillospiraceae bacterium]